jgi:Holliday junction resolvasome RuvABC endonuclease subunit
MTVFRYLMAVDPSLTCSGWALFSVKDGRIAAVGKVKSDPPQVSMATRLLKLQERVVGVLEKLSLGDRDVLVCEAPTTMRDPHNTIKVEQVRGLFESTARLRSVAVPGRVNPRTVQYEVMGLKGKQLVRTEVKLAALRTVIYLYAPRLEQLGFVATEDGLKKHQDIIDALLVGRLMLSRIHAAKDAGMPLASLLESQTPQNRGSWRVRSCGVS